MARQKENYAASFVMGDHAWSLIAEQVADWERESDATKGENKGRPRSLTTRLLVNSIYTNFRFNVPWSVLDRRKEGGSRAWQLFQWMRVRRIHLYVVNVLHMDLSRQQMAIRESEVVS